MIPRFALASAVLAALAAWGCGPRDPRPLAAAGSPNILVVLWDTVRADRMGVYGYGKPTTPFVDSWAKGARVYDDCVSPAPYTVASHGSIFTGILPTEHGASNRHLFLDDRHPTLAELLLRAGYETYLFSANPHISEVENFHRGFDRVEHPWDPEHRDDAFRIVASKITPDDGVERARGEDPRGAPEGGLGHQGRGRAGRARAPLVARGPRSGPPVLRVPQLHGSPPPLDPRVVIRTVISPLTPAESEEYIRHRLSRAGCTRRIPFAKPALKEIIRHARGIPRMINILCDNALLTAFGNRQEKVTKNIVREVIVDRDGNRKPAFQKWALAVLLSLMLVALGMWIRSTVMNGAIRLGKYISF